MNLYFYICDEDMSKYEKYDFLMVHKGWHVVEDYDNSIELYSEIMPKNKMIKILKEKIDDDDFVLNKDIIPNKYGVITIEIPDLTEEELFYYTLKYGKKLLITCKLLIGD